MGNHLGLPSSKGSEQPSERRRGLPQSLREGDACATQTRSRRLEPVNGPEVALSGSFLPTLHNR